MFPARMRRRHPVTETSRPKNANSLSGPRVIENQLRIHIIKQLFEFLQVHRLWEDGNGADIGELSRRSARNKNDPGPGILRQNVSTSCSAIEPGHGIIHQ